MSNKLHINTSSREEVEISLKTGKTTYQEVVERGLTKTQPTLPLIEEILKKAELVPQELDAISIFPGPGSFTGLRVGISIANAFSFALQKKVNNKSLSSIEDAYY